MKRNFTDGFRQPKRGRWRMEWVEFRSGLIEPRLDELRLSVWWPAIKSLALCLLIVSLGRFIPQAWDAMLVGPMLPLFGLATVPNPKVSAKFFDGGGALYNIKHPAFGGVGDGVAVEDAAIAAALAVMVAGDALWYPRGSYKVTTTVQVNARGIRFEGPGFDQSGIGYTGTGACIQLGTDNGHNWDDADYDGAAYGFSYAGMSLSYSGSGTALNNGLANYGAGTYGIRDWRGGNVRLERASLTNWDFPFWGVQSDIDYFQDLIVARNHSGIYLGPRSDQCRMDHVWSFLNDQVFFFEGSIGHEVSHWITDSDGSATTNPCKIRNSVYGTTRPCDNILFDAPWLESLSGGSSAFDVEAFFDIGTGDSQRNGVLTIRNPTVLVQLYSTGGVQHTLHIVKADQCRGVVLDGLTGQADQVTAANLRSVFKIGATASAPPPLWFNHYDIATSMRLVENYHATGVQIYLRTDITNTYLNNVVGGTGAVSLNQMSVRRKWGASSTVPGSAGTGSDMTFNPTWIHGKIWAWISDGSAQQALVWPSVGADRGDTSQTLTVGTDEMIQRWATTLTANRTVTLSVTGATDGCQFRIVRTGLGAFTLDIGGLKTIPASTAAFVEVAYNGGAWLLIGYGLL